uniref:Uncharacterized protein n=1 Tax=Anopheles coluzzii TaxID=1518534 RepID=A0A6E8W8G0_ANOCL
MGDRMEKERAEIVSVTLKDIFRGALPSPADLLPWYIPKCFWRSLVDTRHIAACETVTLARPLPSEQLANDQHCPAQPARDILLQCGISLARLHHALHVLVVSRNGGTVRRLLQLTKEHPADSLHVLVLSDRSSTVEEFLRSCDPDRVTVVRYGRAVTVGDIGSTSTAPAIHGVESDEEILLCGDGSREELYEQKLAKLFHSARLVLEQLRPEACRKGVDPCALYLYRTFPQATFVNGCKIKRLR